MNYLVENINRFADDNRRYKDMRPNNTISKIFKLVFPCFGRFLGNYIVILYLIVKIIYIMINIAQVFIISFFLGNDFWLFGFNIIVNILKEESWGVSTSKYFPSKNFV